MPRSGIPAGQPLKSYLAGATLAERAVNLLSAFREVKLLAFVVTAVNIGGVAYGIIFYWKQLNATVWYLLPFVPDSPTGPFLMIMVFALWWFKGRRRNPTLELLAFIALLKYGVWTVLVFWLYRDAFFAPPRADLTDILLVLHIGEALQAGILLKGMRFPAPRWAAFVALWLLLGDFSDYVLGTHPYLPDGFDPDVGARVVPVMTVALTIICYLAALLWCRRLKRLGGGTSTVGAKALADVLPPP